MTNNLKYRNLIKTIYIQDHFLEHPLNSKYFFKNKILMFIKSLDNDYLFFFDKENSIIYKKVKNSDEIVENKPYFKVLSHRVDDDLIINIFRI